MRGILCVFDERYQCLMHSCVVVKCTSLGCEVCKSVLELVVIEIVGELSGESSLSLNK